MPGGDAPVDVRRLIDVDEAGVVAREAENLVVDAAVEVAERLRAGGARRRAVERGAATRVARAGLIEVEAGRSGVRERRREVHVMHREVDVGQLVVRGVVDERLARRPDVRARIGDGAVDGERVRTGVGDLGIRLLDAIDAGDELARDGRESQHAESQRRDRELALHGLHHAPLRETPALEGVVDGATATL